MKILSTQILQTLSIGSIFELDGKVQSVVVLSAYTDTSFIEKVICHILANGNKVERPHFSIYLDHHASGYSSNKNIRSELNYLAKKLAKKFDSRSGVFLVKSGNLFHSKCIISQSRYSINLLLGSINFTENGFENNEEIAINGKAEVGGNSHINQLVNQLQDYIAETNFLKIGQDNINVKPLSLRQVLLEGEMYYEQKESDPFGFSLNIPENIRDVNQNINSLLGAKINNTLSVEDIVTQTNELKRHLKEKSSTKKSWKKYCIETCYGFWAPIYDRDSIEAVIREKLRVRSPYYHSLFKVIHDYKSVLLKQFEGVASDIEKYVSDQKQLDDDGCCIKWDKKEAITAWDEWHGKLVRKLDSDEFLRRIIVGINPAPVPNVWSDKLSSLEFEESFAESLQYYCKKGQISSSKHAANSFIKKYKLDRNAITEFECLKDLVSYLNLKLASTH